MKATIHASRTRIVDGKPLVSWYGRHEDGTRMEYAFVPSFKPYYYIEGQTIDPHFQDYIEGEPQYRTFDGKPLKKIEVNLPSEVWEAKKRGEEEHFKTYEADIPFTMRVLIDMKIRKAVELDTMTPVPSEGIPIRKVHLDIENDDRKRTTADKADNEILSIGYRDVWDGFTRILTTIPQSKINPLKIARLARGLPLKVISFEDEYQLLDGFVNVLNSSRAPDVLMGWNVGGWIGKKPYGYDFPYLNNRAKKLHLEIPFYKFTLFDLMLAYERMQENRQISSALEYVSGKELGIGKVKHTEGFYEMYANHPEKFCFYNHRDTWLTQQLDEKLGIFDFFYGISEEAGTLDIGRWNAGYIVDALGLRELYETTNMRAPNNNRHIQEVDEVEGGHVFEPSEGIYDLVVVFDFSHEYPSAIIRFNLSHECIVKPGEESPDDVIINGIRFTRKFIGFLPRILNRLLARRAEMKKRMWEYEPTSSEYMVLNNGQRVVKELSNSFYGVLGDEFSRWFDQRIQATITFIPREHVRFVANKVLTVDEAIFNA